MATIYKITNKLNGVDKKEEVKEENNKLIKKDEDQKEQIAMNEMNKSMMYMMPIMSVSISMVAPLGLALYWFISNILMIIERVITSKFIKEE